MHIHRLDSVHLDVWRYGLDQHRVRDHHGLGDLHLRHRDLQGEEASK